MTKRMQRFGAVVFGVALAVGGAAVAARAEGGHGSHAGMSHGDHQSMSQPATGGYGGAETSVPQGVVVRESKVQGYTLVYRLYSWEERMVMMKGMEGHEMAGMDNSGKSSNHLMLFIKGADGKEVSGAQVGFALTAPDKSEQKTLTMGMSQGYGADVALRAKGAYTIRTKAVVGDKALTEEFSYSVK